MNTLNVIIDFGTQNIKWYKQGSGILLSQRTCCVVKTSNNKKMKVIAVGNKAFDKLGSLKDDEKIIYPIKGGLVIHKKAAFFMMQELLKSIKPDTFFKVRLSIIAVISCALTASDKRTIENLLLESGAADVTFVESPVCAGLVYDVHPCVLVDIGASKTEIALLNNSGIILGCTVDIAGDLFTKDISDYVRNKFKMKLGKHMSEKAKISVASLFDYDSSNMRVTGKNIINDEPISISLTAVDCRNAIIEHVERLCDTIEKFTLMIPKSEIEEIYDTGIILAGGSAMLKGLPEYLNRRIGLKVKQIDEPALANVHGASKFIGNEELLKKVLNVENF